MRLIAEISSLLNEGTIPDEAREAGLTLIGWLARRMPGEAVSRCDPMIERDTGDRGCSPPSGRPNGRRSR